MRGAGVMAVIGVVAALAGAAPAAADSPFAWRGIVEGPYGRPWDHAQRTRVLRFMAAHGFNAYVHAPKDDLYQRTQWRQPYPATQQAEFDAEIADARAHGIEWIPNLSPGLPLIPTPRPPEGPPSEDVCYSCPGEIDNLMGKFEPFWKAGARTFMLSFDDVQKGLTHPEDIAAYGQGDRAYGKANGDLLSRFAAALRARDPAARLLSVGADYTGMQDTEYLQGLRETLQPGIEMMWTGPGVFSQNFAPADADAYGRLVGRPPVVWDNWTANDADGNIAGHTNRIHLGAYPRKPDVVGHVRGFFLNPMNEADLNLLPFATAADFFADPAGYDARRSFLRHVHDWGDEPAEALRAFAEVNWSTHFDLADEAPSFRALRDALLGAYDAGGEWVRPRAGLAAELSLVQRAPAVLGAAPALTDVVAQAEPFLAAAARGADAGQAAADLLAAERPALAVDRAGEGFAGTVAPPDPGDAAQARAALSARGDAFRTDSRFTYGYRGMVFDTPPVPAPPNAMDAFLDRARDLDAAWQPRAALAASSVRLTLDGRPVEVGAGGTFRLPAGAAGALLEAVDGAGGRTALLVGGAPRSSARRLRAVLRVLTRRARVGKRGLLRLRVACVGDPGAKCRGRLRLRATLRDLRRVGERRLALAVGPARTLRLRLSAAVRRRIARHRRGVRVRVLLLGSPTARVTLLRR